MDTATVRAASPLWKLLDSRGIGCRVGILRGRMLHADFLITIDGALERGTKSGRINTGPLTTLSLVLVALENFPYAIMWSFPIAYLSRKER